MKRDKETGLILMTALLPTRGHVNLIKFALEICEEVDVVISTRSFEPAIVKDRVQWFKNEFAGCGVVSFYEHADDTAPQNPQDHPDFWNWWKNAVAGVTGRSRYDAVVASEQYGVNLAEAFEAKFIPFDVRRDIDDFSGTSIRKNIFVNWDKIIPSARKSFLSKFVMFGQESVGKSTIAKSMGKYDLIKSYPEYARQYLEAVGAELSREKMLDITRGQLAYQRMAGQEENCYSVVFDTDLFSTIGYYEIMNHKEWMDEDWSALGISIDEIKNDVYFILPDDVPFAPDELRYGGDRRESTTQFWIDIAERYHLNYVVVIKGNLFVKEYFINDYVQNYNREKFKELMEFRRD